MEVEQAIRRRRECEACGFRFTTHERVEAATLIVLKKDGKRETFSIEKLRKGIGKALEKRPITDIQMEDFLAKIERELNAGGASEITSKEIGRVVLERLRRLDDVAYLRFASVYKSFDTIDSFKKELENIT